MTIYIFMFHIFVNNVRTFHDTDAVFIVLIRVYIQLNSYRETDSIPQFRVLSSPSFSITKHRTKDISCASNILQIYINQTFYYVYTFNQTYAQQKFGLCITVACTICQIHDLGKTIQTKI